jgi:hypothetical protein
MWRLFSRAETKYILDKTVVMRYLVRQKRKLSAFEHSLEQATLSISPSTLKKAKTNASASVRRLAQERKNPVTSVLRRVSPARVYHPPEPVRQAVVVVKQPVQVSVATVSTSPTKVLAKPKPKARSPKPAKKIKLPKTPKRNTTNKKGIGGKAPRKNFAKEQTAVLKTWLFANEAKPYPTLDQKGRFIEVTGLTMSQINHWFINARQRLVKKTKKAAKYKLYANSLAARQQREAIS